jgi:sugar phosphate isomerase/epimerase
VKLVFSKSNWEMSGGPLEEFLKKTKESGFSLAEIYLQSLKEKPDKIVNLHTEYGLGLIAQIITKGKTPDDHRKSFEKQFSLALECKASFINSHTGRDIFSFKDNARIIQSAIELAETSGISLCHETHRGRPTYSAVETGKYLDALPRMRITADFSHWMVVHESDLEDQKEVLDLACERSDHIHARVGYEEGPQITDPRAPEWKVHVENHMKFWQKIVNARKNDGQKSLTITPEFGPPAYMHTLPFTNLPVADVWEINVYMKQFLEKRLNA